MLIMNARKRRSHLRRERPRRRQAVGLAGMLLGFLVVAGMGTGAAAQDDAPAARMTLNVKDMPVQDVLKLIAERGQLDLAIGNGVTGKLTLMVQDTPVEDLLRLAVDMAGLAWAKENGVHRILTPDAYEARYGRPYRDINRKRFLALEHAPVQEVLPSLTPLRSSRGQIVADARSNGLVVIESPSRLRQIESVIEALDRPLPTRALELRTVPAQEMATRLQAYLPANTLVEADPAGKRVLVTASEATLEHAAALVQLLDRSEGPQTRVFRLTNVVPDSLRTQLEDLLTPDVGRLATDPRSRSLIVTDFPEALEAVAGRVDALDTRVPQVLIEARIIQVNLDDERKTGIDWEVLEESLNDLDVRASFPILSEGDDGIEIRSGDLQSDDYQLLVQALETFGRTNLLSSPRIMVADGGSARIHVGSQVPYTTIDTREGPNGVIDRFEKVTIVDVGVQLKVTVRIHNDGMVTMQVEPEVSSVTGFSNDIPIVETSETSSIVSIHDGRTVILGGLNKDEIRKTRKGIPILGRLPLLKYLFSSTSEKKTRTELAILLTPHIVSGEETSEEAGRLMERQRSWFGDPEEEDGEHD